MSCVSQALVVLTGMLNRNFSTSESTSRAFISVSAVITKPGIPFISDSEHPFLESDSGKWRRFNFVNISIF